MMMMRNRSGVEEEAEIFSNTPANDMGYNNKKYKPNETVYQ